MLTPTGRNSPKQLRLDFRSRGSVIDTILRFLPLWNGSARSSASDIQRTDRCQTHSPLIIAFCYEVTPAARLKFKRIRDAASKNSGVTAA
jgi:hypothetical protein